METYDAIQNRHSHRSFLPKQVPFDDIAKILEAGKAAPSAGNLQNWKFILITKEAKKQRIAEACAEQLWMQDAPMYIVIVGEPSAAKRHYGTRGERLYTIQSAAAAIENMLIMAADLKLASCWIGAVDEDVLRRELSLPSDAVPYAILPIGYPQGEPEKPPEKRIEFVTYFETWGQTRKYQDSDVGMNSTIIQDVTKETAVKGKKLAERIKKKVQDKLKKKKK